MNKFFLLLAFASGTLIAQNTCKSSETSIQDLNSITKCLNKNTKQVNKKSTRQISVRTTSQSNRYLRKRNFRQVEVEKTTEYTENDLNSITISKDMIEALSKKP